jgi:hypothetical protein
MKKQKTKQTRNMKLDLGTRKYFFNLSSLYLWIVLSLGAVIMWWPKSYLSYLGQKVCGDSADFLIHCFASKT